MIKDNVVVVTGGAGLMGRTFARGIAQEEGVVIIADVNNDAGADTLLAVQREFPGARADYISVDITSKNSIQDMIGRIMDTYGRIDALVNNAYPRNKHYGRRLEDVSYEDFCDNVARHLGGYFLTSQQIAEYFKKQGRGTIVNISSIYGVMAPRFELYEGTEMTMPIEYAAVKSALIQLTKYMAKYYKGYGIRVNAISPGGILDRQPAVFVDRYKKHSLSKGMLQTADVVGTLLFLLSDSSHYINGQNIIVDDGFSL